jgi:hypothetical protein
LQCKLQFNEYYKLLPKISDCFEGIDSAKVNGYAVLYQGKEVLLNYPEIKDGNGKKFSPIGRSFHHGRFIQNLRAEVMKENKYVFFILKKGVTYCYNITSTTST